MNNLSFLRVSYMENLGIDSMIEIAKYTKNLSWRDIQGLSWIIEESELNNQMFTSACA